jgi:hypothetical protein
MGRWQTLKRLPPDVRFTPKSGHQRLKIAAVQLDPEPHSVGHKSLL